MLDECHFQLPLENSSAIVPFVQMEQKSQSFTSNNSDPARHETHIEKFVKDSFSIPCSEQTQSYKEWWIKLFERIPTEQDTELSIPLDKLRSCAFVRELHGSPFRSLCWRIYLQLLPTDVTDWRSKLGEYRRRFASLICQVNRDPRESNSDDHPLCVNQNSLWYQHFDAGNIRRVIAQDVDRTFPNEPHFREPSVQMMMTDLLHCYTIRSQFCYKQGMHEILAPICLVFHHDYATFQRVRETDQLSDLARNYLSIVFDPQHFEADVYTVFEHVMDRIKDWYLYEKSPSYHEDVSTMTITTTTITKNLGPDNHNPGLAYLDDVHHQLLRQVDQKLYLHLKYLEINPALFGLRWIRLLFGHEFGLDNLLYVWDCIFAIDENFVFVRYVYVAMLNYLSPELISREFSECLGVLMNFPADVDVSTLIKNALHLYDPVQHPPVVNKATQATRMSDNLAVRMKNPSPQNITLSDKTVDRSQSLVRGKNFFDFSRLNQSRAKSRSSINLTASNLGKEFAEGFLLAFSSQNTPIPTPATTRKSYRQSQEKVKQIYRKCVQALEICSAHVDVAICRQNRSSIDLDGHFMSVVQTNLNNTSENLDPMEHLLLAKLELERLKGLLDELTTLGGYSTSSPLIQRRLLYDTSGNNARRESNSTIDWLPSPESARQSMSKRTSERTDLLNRRNTIGYERSESLSPQRHLKPPGSIIRMETLNTSNRESKGHGVQP